VCKLKSERDIFKIWNKFIFVGFCIVSTSL
jgi:hypothetical protein